MAAPAGTQLGVPSIPYLPVVDLTVAPAPVTVPASNSHAGKILAGCGLIIAITWIEDSGTNPCFNKLYDGQDATGPIIAYFGGPAASSGHIGPGVPGIYFRNGLFLVQSTGATDLTITYLPLLNPLP
jgi:hypothetical protein